MKQVIPLTACLADSDLHNIYARTFSIRLFFPEKPLISLTITNTI